MDIFLPFFGYMYLCAGGKSVLLVIIINVVLKSVVFMYSLCSLGEKWMLAALVVLLGTERQDINFFLKKDTSLKLQIFISREKESAGDS